MKLNLNYLILTLLSFMLSVTAWAGDIKGCVRDKTTGEPLPGAMVKVVETAQGAVTDMDGNYILKKVKSGKFSYISKFHIIISCKLIVYIVMCFYQETN